MEQVQTVGDIMPPVPITPTAPAATQNLEEKNDPWIFVNQVYRRVLQTERGFKQKFLDMADPEIYNGHSQLIMEIANRICLAGQNNEFVVDDDNRLILRFLLYYFNNCPLACEVFPDLKLTLDRPILLMGGVGTGKTLIMQIFSEYLRLTDNPNYFYNVSVSQMVNYYTMHNNIDKYTYNEGDAKGFDIAPMNLCLNDLGVDSREIFGVDTKTITADFLHARNEVWTMTAPNRRKFAHITTNLTIKELKEKYSDEHHRLVDRFKTYNILFLKGESRR